MVVAVVVVVAAAVVVVAVAAAVGVVGRRLASVAGESLGRQSRRWMGTEEAS